jgi:hypothetical protein
MTGDTLASSQNFYRRMGSTSEPHRRSFLKSRLVGMVLPAEPFGVAVPTKIWARVESKSAEKETCAVHIAHEHCPQHTESPQTQTSSLPEQDGIVGLTTDHPDGQPREGIGLPSNVYKWSPSSVDYGKSPQTIETVARNM